VDAAFTFSNISTLVGAASLDNKSSCKLMEYCGLTRSRLVYRQSESRSEVELQEYVITRDSWASTPRQRTFAQAPISADIRLPVHVPSLVPGALELLVAQESLLPGNRQDANASISGLAA
jgi:hypothetical protein